MRKLVFHPFLVFLTILLFNIINVPTAIAQSPPPNSYKCGWHRLGYCYLAENHCNAGFIPDPANCTNNNCDTQQYFTCVDPTNKFNCKPPVGGLGPCLIDINECKNGLYPPLGACSSNTNCSKSLQNCVEGDNKFSCTTTTLGCSVSDVQCLPGYTVDESRCQKIPCSTDRFGCIPAEARNYYTCKFNGPVCGIPDEIHCDQGYAPPRENACGVNDCGANPPKKPCVQKDNKFECVSQGPNSCILSNEQCRGGYTTPTNACNQCCPYSSVFDCVPIGSTEPFSCGIQLSQKIFCSPSGDPTTDPATGKIYTAIGCIPIRDTQAFVEFLLRWLIGIAGGIALIFLIYSSFLIMTSAGDTQRLKAGKELLTAVLMGIILLIFGVFILDLIGVKILNIPGFGR